MKKIYVILAFHAHELLWDLPQVLLSHLKEGNPMKESVLDENYLKKRREEDRNIYSLCSRFGDRIKAALCVEYSNELLSQISKVLPDTFEEIKADYRRGRLYPLYGHAHHTHVSLLDKREITQEILWNMEYLHDIMGVPYPLYKGLFPAEASLSYDKMEGITEANIDYFISPHLNRGKTEFTVKGEGDWRYKPFLVRAGPRFLLSLPRNFPISQEIWRPITKMKREAVKNQGYMLGTYPVFTEEYLYKEREVFPINMEEGVELYKKVLRQELSAAPPGGLLVYIQDLELMDYGDIALEIMEKAWKGILEEDSKEYSINFVTPDEYIENLKKGGEIENLPEVVFDKITWAPEIRPVLRVDGHYPPLGVEGKGDYIEGSGIKEYPHVFWENGKYYCRIFDDFLNIFCISLNLPLGGGWLDHVDEFLFQTNEEIKSLLLLRLMKRACNWGWRPTEGRQKLPSLKGYLICQSLKKRMKKYPTSLIWRKDILEFTEIVDEKNLVGLREILDIFLDKRIAYLKNGIKNLEGKGEIDLAEIQDHMEQTFRWKETGARKVEELYYLKEERSTIEERIYQALTLVQDYSQALFMATDHIQRIWALVPDVDFMVENMYEYLYDLYPPLFPGLLNRVDSMSREEIEKYFREKKSLVFPL
ncbi:MAG: glycoside hydrolase [Candidatus Syntrophonatronum acetioxidans]|uniref:Glycoside hydrolase n=1 Tax=Candidatus Syntrophonatronum acetioxidans TaxID=1795816 RepID=A0A424YGV6_9FIRM|nr:MAG: glycoside hydrolase [Candidatus Syntrophonatronum acetioxidans]